jgi:hypothetical protein
MTVERDDLKEAVANLRRRIRDLEATSTRTTGELVGALLPLPPPPSFSSPFVPFSNP